MRLTTAPSFLYGFSGQRSATLPISLVEVSVMLQLLILWLPNEVGSAALLVAIAGALTGAVLWLSGARFSRTLVGLVAVAIGAVIGMELPRWLGWSISGEGPLVGFALAFGVAGYLFHRLWVGVGLGLVLAGWAFLATWVFLKAPATFDWPTANPGGSASDYFLQIWQSLPANVAGVLPIACGGSVMLGLLTTIFWPRLAIATAWSAAGASLLSGLGSAAVEFGRPQWLRLMPQQLGSQFLALAVLVVVGIAAQWNTAQTATGQAAPISGRPGSTSGSKGKPAPRPMSEGAD
jgi:hypothetical protein